VRTLSDPLKAEQRDKNVSPYISVTLVAPGGSPTYTYTTADSPNRIFKIDSTEALFGSTAQTTIQLKNDDQFFSAKDLRGYKVTIGWGCYTGSNEKSDAAPLWVRSQRDRSEEGVLLTELVCVDAWWKLAQLDVIGGGVELRGTIVGTFQTGEAVTNGGQGGGTGVALRVLLVGADFITVTGVTGTFLTSDVVTGSTSFATITLTQAGTTGGGVGAAPSFGNATIRNILASLVADVADMVDDTAGNDTTLNGTSDYEPSNFDSILGLVKRFEEMTNSVLVYKADGKMHLTWLNPAPAAYDYEYDTVHCFIIDFRERVLVIPNKVFVIAEMANAASTWAVANDTTSQAAIGVVSKVYEDPDIAGNAALAQLRANALLFRLQQEASKGRALVPMNCGQEVMDYVLITDSRAATTIVGRIGMLTRHYASGTYSMEISLGEAFDFLDTENPQSFLDSLQTYGYGRLMVPGGVITGPLSSPSVSLEADQVHFLPAVLANWAGSADPGETDDALDQLASRAKALETAPPAHVILSAAHSDTLAGSVLDGDVIIGNTTPKWSRLAISIPAANVRNLLGIDNAELRPSWKTALDATNPADIAAAASPGTSLVFAHRDHVHAHPDLGDLHTGYLTPAEHTAIGDGAPHHAKYTNAEAIAAVEGEATLDLTGAVTVVGTVGIGTTTPLPKVDIRAAWAALTQRAQLGLYTTDAYAQDRGGVLSLGGKYLTGADDTTEFAGIGGLKENANASDFAGYLVLYTRPVGGNFTERMRISSVGVITINASLSVDTIAEKTADAGVTIEQVLSKDGNIYPSNQSTRYIYDNGTSIVSSGPFQSLGTLTTILSKGTSVYGLDGNLTGSSVADNGTLQPFGAIVFSGLFLVNDTYSGNMAICLQGGNSLIIVSQTIAGQYTTTADTDTKLNIYLSSNYVTIQNMLGVTAEIRVLAFRIRESL